MTSGKVGTIVTGKMVRKAMIATVKLWQPDYLAEIAEQDGRDRGALPLFRSFVSMADLSKFNEDQLPTCVVVAPGTQELPTLEREEYTVPWTVGVGCVVSGKDSENTYELSELYTAAVRSLVMQHRSLGVDFVESTEWTGERYDDLGTDDTRSIAAGVVQFTVTVRGVLNPNLGLLVPSGDITVSPGDWPEAMTVDIATVGS